MADLNDRIIDRIMRFHRTYEFLPNLVILGREEYEELRQEWLEDYGTSARRIRHLGLYVGTMERRNHFEVTTLNRAENKLVPKRK